LVSNIPVVSWQVLYSGIHPYKRPHPIQCLPFCRHSLYPLWRASMRPFVYKDNERQTGLRILKPLCLYARLPRSRLPRGLHRKSGKYKCRLCPRGLSAWFYSNPGKRINRFPVYPKSAFAQINFDDFANVKSGPVPGCNIFLG